MGVLKEGRLRDIYVPLIIFSLVLAGGVIAAQFGPELLFVAITTGNNAPIVYNTTAINSTAVTLTDAGNTLITVNFTVLDADGTANINNAKTGVNVTFNGIKISNNSGTCLVGDVSSTTRSFNCTITFRYFHNASTLWEINLSTEDNAGAKAHNDSQSPGSGAANNLTVNSLSAFNLQTPSVVVTSASLGSTNNELTIVVNNTGNFDFTILNVTPFELNASLTDFFALNGNFSINATASTSDGFGDNLVNATPRNFSAGPQQTSATLPHKITNGEADKLSNRTLYIYIDVPSNKGLSSGVTYNSSVAWELFAE